MQKLKKISISLIIFIFVICSFSPSIKKIANADYTEYYGLSINLYETKKEYIIAFYNSSEMMEFDENSRLKVYINGIPTIYYSPSIEIVLEKTEMSYRVYAEIIMVEENNSSVIFKSQTLELEGSKILSKNNTKFVLTTVLPILLTTIILILFVILRKKTKVTALDFARDKMKQNYSLISKTIKVLENNEIPSRKMTNTYYKCLKNITKNINNSLRRLIPENIENLGQFEELMNIMQNVENMTKAGAKLADKTNNNKKFKILKSLQTTFLVKISKTISDLQNAIKKREIATSNLFIQHSQSQDILKTFDECEKFLTNVLNSNKSQNDES